MNRLKRYKSTIMNPSVTDNKFLSLQSIASEYCQLGNSYAYAHIGPIEPKVVSDNEPQKIDGMILFLVKEGEVTLEINLEKYVFKANSFAVIHYGALVRFLHTAKKSFDSYFICYTTEFLHGINVNFAAISVPTFIGHQSPEQVLSSEEADLIVKYFDLMKLNAMAKVNEQVEKNIASSLTSAMVYQLVQFHYKRIGQIDSVKGQRSCRNAYVHDFLKLVHIHYQKERAVAFYADKLCISPKYLSLLVKETTGKSAAKWIDDFVLMEAKNLLRFSGKNVQQVAYALNFSNQSSFGKYFKHMTGLSPTEYQKS